MQKAYVQPDPRCRVKKSVLYLIVVILAWEGVFTRVVMRVG